MFACSEPTSWNFYKKRDAAHICVCHLYYLSLHILSPLIKHVIRHPVVATRILITPGMPYMQITLFRHPYSMYTGRHILYMYFSLNASSLVSRIL